MLPKNYYSFKCNFCNFIFSVHCTLWFQRWIGSVYDRMDHSLYKLLLSLHSSSCSDAAAFGSMAWYTMKTNISRTTRRSSFFHHDMPHALAVQAVEGAELARLEAELALLEVWLAAKGVELVVKGAELALLEAELAAEGVELVVKGAELVVVEAELQVLSKR